ncbi:MAG: phosphoglycerate dehydrogenase [Acidobacteriota bacterium]
MKVLISDMLSPQGIAYLEQQPGIEVANRPGLSPQELLQEIRDADALLVRSKTRVTAEVLASASQLKAIGRAGAGIDNIDLKAATAQGIVVMNTPGGSSVSVAEHVFALMLALARNIPSAHASLSKGQWLKSSLTGTELNGKSLGLVGLGKIGSLVAQRGRAFGMNLLAYDPFISQEYAQSLGIELRRLGQVFEEADFISLHLPFNDKTRGLVSRALLERMKPQAYLINAARGGLIQEEDLIEALDKGRIAGAGLDVFASEPQVNPRLLRCKRLVATPHIAGSTVEAQAKVGYGIAVQIADFLLRGIICNAVNFPSVSPEERERLMPYLRLGERLGALVSSVCSIRYSQIGIRYYGEISRLNYKPVSNRILKAVLQPNLSEEVNDINARSRAQERGVDVVETVSSRGRSHSNLISIQLRSANQMSWVEGAVMHHGQDYLVSVDGIPIEARLGKRLLFIRNQDRPGVIGQVGTILGDSGVNIASFVLGRNQQQADAVGIAIVDDPVPEKILERIEEIPAIRFAQVIEFGLNG